MDVVEHCECYDVQQLINKLNYELHEVSELNFKFIKFAEKQKLVDCAFNLAMHLCNMQYELLI